MKSQVVRSWLDENNASVRYIFLNDNSMYLGLLIRVWSESTAFSTLTHSARIDSCSESQSKESLGRKFHIETRIFVILDLS